MHTSADTYVAVDTAEWLPLNLLLLRVDLDGHPRTDPLTVLALVTLHHVKADLAPGPRDGVRLNEGVVNGSRLAEQVLDDVS